MTNIESPCGKVCALDPTAAICVGCGRNLAEIEGWLRFGPIERARIMAALPQRRAALGHVHEDAMPRLLPGLPGGATTR